MQSPATPRWKNRCRIATPPSISEKQNNWQTASNRTSFSILQWGNFAGGSKSWITCRNGICASPQTLSTEWKCTTSVYSETLSGTPTTTVLSPPKRILVDTEWQCAAAAVGDGASSTCTIPSSKPKTSPDSGEILPSACFNRGSQGGGQCLDRLQCTPTRFRIEGSNDVAPEKASALAGCPSRRADARWQSRHR